MPVVVWGAAAVYSDIPQELGCSWGLLSEHWGDELGSSLVLGSLPALWWQTGPYWPLSE